MRPGCDVIRISRVILLHARQTILDSLTHKIVELNGIGTKQAQTRHPRQERDRRFDVRARDATLVLGCRSWLADLDRCGFATKATAIAFRRWARLGVMALFGAAGPAACGSRRQRWVTLTGLGHDTAKEAGQGFGCTYFCTNQYMPILKFDSFWLTVIWYGKGFDSVVVMGGM